MQDEDNVIVDYRLVLITSYGYNGGSCRATTHSGNNNGDIHVLLMKVDISANINASINMACMNSHYMNGNSSTNKNHKIWQEASETS